MHLRRVPEAIILLLLVAIVWMAISGGIRQLPNELTTGQSLQTLLQILAGILSLLVVASHLVRRNVGDVLIWTWGVCLSLAAGLSGLVWGPPMPFIGLLFAAMAGGFSWLTSRILRRQPSNAPVTASPGV